MHEREQRRHIAALDGLRGVAALSVVIFHMTGQTVLGPFPASSYLAVDFFFVLSGFVIARTYERRLVSDMSIWNFTRTRLIRLYPLILLGTVIGFTVKLGTYLIFPGSNGPTILVEALFFGLLLIPNKGHLGDAGGMFDLDGPTWSLMLEIWANLLYAITVSILTTKRLALIVAAGAVAVGVASVRNHGLQGGYSLETFWVGVARVWFSFFAGVLIYRLIPAKVPRVPTSILATALVLSFVPTWGPWYDIVVVLTLYPAIVVLGAADPISPRWRSVAITAGALSYPLYILHSPTLRHFHRFQSLHGPTLILLLILATIGVICISFAANRWYDEPLRRWLGQRRQKNSVKQAVVIISDRSP